MPHKIFRMGSVFQNRHGKMRDRQNIEWMWRGRDGRSEGGKFIESGAFRPGGDEGADRRAERRI